MGEEVKPGAALNHNAPAFVARALFSEHPAQDTHFSNAASMAHSGSIAFNQDVLRSSLKGSLAALLACNQETGSPISSGSFPVSESASGRSFSTAFSFHSVGEPAPSVSAGMERTDVRGMAFDKFGEAPAAAPLDWTTCSSVQQQDGTAASSGIGVLFTPRKDDARRSLRVTAPPFVPSPSLSPSQLSPSQLSPLQLSPSTSPNLHAGFSGGGCFMSPQRVAQSPDRHELAPPQSTGSSSWGGDFLHGRAGLLGGGQPMGGPPHPHSPLPPLQSKNHFFSSGTEVAAPWATNGPSCDGEPGERPYELPPSAYADGAASCNRALCNWNDSRQNDLRKLNALHLVPAAEQPSASVGGGQQLKPLPVHGISPPPSLPGAMGGPWNTASAMPSCASACSQAMHVDGSQLALDSQQLPGGGATGLEAQAFATFSSLSSTMGLSHLQIMNLQHTVSKLALTSPNKQDLRKLLQGFLSQERVGEAHAFVTMVRIFGLPTDVVMYNLLMTAYKKRRQWQMVMQVMQQMQTTQVMPDIVSYNILIDACGKAQQVPRAFEFYEEMVRRGLQPGVNTYTSLIDACGKTQQLKKAYELLIHMQEEGVQPNAHTFTTIINACAQAQDLELGLQVLQQMVRCGAAHDVGQSTITPYTTLIRACGKAYAVDKAFDVMRCMLDVGLKPNTVTFNCLIDACSRGNELDKAFQVLRLMYHYNNLPDAVTYTALIDACIKNGALGRACQLLHQMRREEHTPPSNMISSLLDECNRAGELDRSFDVLQTMAEAGMRPACSAFTALIAACGRASAPERAFDVLRYMQALKVRPNASTHTALIDACVQARDVIRAMTALQEMLRASEVPEPAVFNSLLELCSSTSQLEGASRVYFCMRQMGIIPNSLTYRALIDVFLKCGEVRKAELAAYEMAAAGWEPDSATAERLLIACASRPESVATLPVMLQRLISVIEPKQRSPLLIRLIEALTLGGNPAYALQMVGYLQAEPARPDLESLVGLRAQLTTLPGLYESETGRALLNVVTEMLPPVLRTPVPTSPPSTGEPSALTTADCAM